MATHYAWTDIRVGSAKHDQTVPGEVKVIKYGDTVTASAIGGEEELNAKIESGSVREEKPPKLPDAYQGSPLDFLREERARLNDDEVLVATGGSIFAPTDAEVLTGAANLDPDAKMPADGK